ncbi:jg8259, partial [Pararge aegeria aegeria]
LWETSPWIQKAGSLPTTPVGLQLHEAGSPSRMRTTLANCGSVDLTSLWELYEELSDFLTMSSVTVKLSDIQSHDKMRAGVRTRPPRSESEVLITITASLSLVLSTSLLYLILSSSFQPIIGPLQGTRLLRQREGVKSTILAQCGLVDSTHLCEHM